ncbi:MAG TPA: hypothetical protein VF017_18005 [Thermoanaerobaculia bacterium]|nr:hypothetical protein [Thermoanaerobaculia bacterium]
MKPPPAPHVAAAVARGQGGAAQAKLAPARVSNARPSAASQAKPAPAPHVAAAVAAGRGGGGPVQAKPAPALPPKAAVVQRADDDPYARKFGQYDFKRTAKSPRLRELDDERRDRVARAPYARADDVGERKKGMWNGSTRPSFEDATWVTMLGTCATLPHATGITVYQCTANRTHPAAIYVPRARDLAGLSVANLEAHFGKAPGESKGDFLARANVITLDHKTQWKKYILENAEPDEDGEITAKAARDAYNDVGNLVAMCQSCNSSKNGKKGVYD